MHWLYGSDALADGSANLIHPHPNPLPHAGEGEKGESEPSGSLSRVFVGEGWG